MKLKLPDFGNKAELLEYLVKNKGELIDIKKSAIKNADAVGGFAPECALVSKALVSSQDTADVIYRTIVGNTYNYMDSHEDAHLDNLFAQSIKDRGTAKIRHQHDHINQVVAKVGKFLNIYEQTVNWTDVGLNKAGQTMALLADSAIKRAWNQLVFDSYKDGEIDQHSVGMMYDKVFLGVNDKKYREEYDVWTKYAHLLGNREVAEEKGYCFFVKQAKLIEISCVTEGSNDLTGMYNPPFGSVANIDPPQKQSKSYYSNFL